MIDLGEKKRWMSSNEARPPPYHYIVLANL